jgi:hypothetical protein
MGLRDVLLDKLGQSPGAHVESRRSLLGGLALVIAATGSSQPASGKKRGKKRGKKHGKKRCKLQNRCGNGCCNPDSCFAESVDPDAPENVTFACCPADKLCRSTNPNFDFKDQCCYPDETCQPSLVDEFGFNTETICCRPCNGVCCLKQNEECINGVCTLVSTARLPRTRRPG